MDNTINKQFTFDDNREISEQMAPWFIISIMIQTGDDCLVIVTGVAVVIALRHTAAVHPLPVPANRIRYLFYEKTTFGLAPDTFAIDLPKIDTKQRINGHCGKMKTFCP